MEWVEPKNTLQRPFLSWSVSQFWRSSLRCIIGGSIGSNVSRQGKECAHHHIVLANETRNTVSERKIRMSLVLAKELIFVPEELEHKVGRIGELDEMPQYDTCDEEETHGIKR